MARAAHRWPSLVAFPLFSAHGATGALDLASLFASHTAGALHGARRTEGLHAALHSRDVIGQAEGANTKLVDVATWLLEDGGR